MANAPQTLDITRHDPKWRWFGWLRGRSSAELGEQRQEPMVVVGGSRTTRVSDERAMQVSAVWSCARLISETIGKLPITVFRGQRWGGRTRDDQHWLALLLRRPNPWMTGQEFKEGMTLGLVLWGNAYARIHRNDRGQPVSLYPMRPEKMRVERRGPRGEQVFYLYQHENNAEEVIPADNMLHVKGFGDGWVGLSPLGYARATTGAAVAQDDYANKFFTNGGKQPGILSSSKSLTPDQRAQVREAFGDLVRESDDDLFVLPADLSFTQIAINPTDAEFLQQRRYSDADIARFFRVPPHLIFDTEKNTTWGTGLEQQNLGFWQYTLEPIITRFEQTIERRVLGSEASAHFVEHDLRDLLRADSKTRAAYLGAMVNNGIMTRNEGRVLEGLERVDDPEADKLTVQVSMSPLDLLGQAVTGGASSEE